MGMRMCQGVQTLFCTYRHLHLGAEADCLMLDVEEVNLLARPNGEKSAIRAPRDASYSCDGFNRVQGRAQQPYQQLALGGDGCKLFRILG